MTEWLIAGICSIRCYIRLPCTVWWISVYLHRQCLLGHQFREATKPEASLRAQISKLYLQKWQRLPGYLGVGALFSILHFTSRRKRLRTSVSKFIDFRIDVVWEKPALFIRTKLWRLCQPSIVTQSWLLLGYVPSFRFTSHNVVIFYLTYVTWFMQVIHKHECRTVACL